MSGLTELERSLVEGCRTGDEAAWSTLFRTYAPDLRRYLRSMGIAEADADDLVQTVLIQFLKSLARFRGEASLRTWLHRIARNVALQAMRGSGRRRKHLEAYAQRPQADVPGPEAGLQARQRLEWVFHSLDQLDENFREVWVLREVQHLDVAECAEVLDIPPATVRSRHHRARRQLLALLEGAERDGSHLQLVASKGEAS